MDSFEETTKSISSKKGFFHHVFHFDEESKHEVMNLIQYALIAIIPIVVLNKLSQKFVPEADEQKGSVEILAEVMIQVLVVFLGIFIIHRIITYIPTYSGNKYPEFNVIWIVLAVLMITMSLQTKLGEKVSILVDRVVDLWEGTTGSSDGKKKKGSGSGGTVRISQPISGQQSTQSQINAISNSLYGGQNNGGGGGGTMISSLPTVNSTQQSPNYDAMYRNDSTPLVNAATPGYGGASDGGYNEPMAANDSFGGGAFGSLW
jgi:hypothetical protein